MQVFEVDDLKYVIELKKAVSNEDNQNKFIFKQEFEITEYKVRFLFKLNKSVEVY